MRRSSERGSCCVPAPPACSYVWLTKGSACPQHPQAGQSPCLSRSSDRRGEGEHPVTETAGGRASAGSAGGGRARGATRVGEAAGAGSQGHVPTGPGCSPGGAAGAAASCRCAVSVVAGCVTAGSPKASGSLHSGSGSILRSVGGQQVPVAPAARLCPAGRHGACCVPRAPTPVKPGVHL